jgi:hypothetical protein
MGRGLTAGDENEAGPRSGGRSPNRPHGCARTWSVRAKACPVTPGRGADSDPRTLYRTVSHIGRSPSHPPNLTAPHFQSSSPAQSIIAAKIPNDEAVGWGMRDRADRSIRTYWTYRFGTQAESSGSRGGRATPFRTGNKLPMARFGCHAIRARRVPHTGWNRRFPALVRAVNNPPPRQAGAEGSHSPILTAMGGCPDPKSYL